MDIARILSNPDVPALAPPFLGQPVEICIVTPNLRQTLSGLLSLGIGPFKIFHFAPHNVSEQTIRGQPTPFDIEVAFAVQNKMIWEVMQPIKGPTVMQEFLDNTNAKGGIHHIAFDCGESNDSNPVPRVACAARVEAVRRREKFEKRGFPLAQSGVWHGKRGTCEFMFFETEGAINTCFETYVFSDDWEDPEDLERFPPSS